MATMQERIASLEAFQRTTERDLAEIKGALPELYRQTSLLQTIATEQQSAKMERNALDTKVDDILSHLESAKIIWRWRKHLAAIFVTITAYSTGFLKAIFAFLVTTAR